MLVLTMLEGDEAITAALRAGAAGYLLEGADRNDIERATTDVAVSGTVVGNGGVTP